MRHTLCLFPLLLTLACGDAPSTQQTPPSLDGPPQTSGDPTGITTGETTGATTPAEETPDTGVARCDLSEDAPALRLLLFHDKDSSARSRWQATLTGEDEPLAWHRFTLHTPSGQALTGRTCADGTAAIPDLSPGVYLIEPELDAAQRVSNGAFSPRFAAARERGQARIVTFGDSVPAYGPQPWFTARLSTLAAPLLHVEDVNVARPGSRSDEWLPGGANYNNRLRPMLQGADVIVFSLGGNDMYDILERSNGGQDINAALAAFDTKIAEVKANLLTIIAQLRQDAPQAEIIWLLYPNFAKSDLWSARVGSAIGAVQLLLMRTLRSLRQELGAMPELTLLDMFGATEGEDLNMLLYDELHFNALGHALCARELFATLGGLSVDAQGAGERVYTISVSAR